MTANRTPGVVTTAEPDGSHDLREFDAVPPEFLCSVIASARMRGPQMTAVRGIAAAVAAATGSTHISVRLGGVLLYLEDRAALDALTAVAARAEQLADEVFGARVDHVELERTRVRRTEAELERRRARREAAGR